MDAIFYIWEFFWTLVQRNMTNLYKVGCAQRNKAQLILLMHVYLHKIVIILLFILCLFWPAHVLCKTTIGVCVSFDVCVSFSGILEYITSLTSQCLISVTFVYHLDRDMARSIQIQMILTLICINDSRYYHYFFFFPFCYEHFLVLKM